MFDALTAQPADKILALMAAYKATRATSDLLAQECRGTTPRAPSRPAVE